MMARKDNKAAGRGRRGIRTMTETDQQHAEDGPRLKHFRQAIQKMLQASIKQCTYYWMCH